MPSPLNLTGSGEPERLTAAAVTGNYFRRSECSRSLGRTFLLENEKPGSDQVAVLSHGLWQKRFGGDPSIVNRTIVLDGRNFAMSSASCRKTSIFRKLQSYGFRSTSKSREGMKQRKAHFMRPIGKLKAGSDAGASASRHWTLIAARLEEQYPDSNLGWSLRLVSLREQLCG